MTIFVAGAHGVGKTYLSIPVAKKLRMRYATASQLIREERGRASWSGDKLVGEIDENQAALIQATQRIKTGGEKLLLDGHFVLRSTPFVHHRIDEHVFLNLQCTRFIIVTAPIQVIFNRLQERGDNSWTAEEISNLCDAEVDHGRAVGLSLGIPVAVLTSPDAPDLAGAITSAQMKTRRSD